MSPSSKETQRQTLLHLWNEGIRDASELHSRTHIPLSTIYYNINKLEKNGSVNHKRGNGRPRKITANVSRAISQYVRRDSSMSGTPMLTSTHKENRVAWARRHLNDN
jgi:DNA-binding MarR family transcriptional regulator